MNLRPFQEESRDFLVARGRAVLGDEPGLGKTRTLAATYLALPDRGDTTLVSTIKVAFYQWQLELTNNVPNAQIFFYSGTPQQRSAAWVRYLLSSPKDGPRFIITNHAVYGELIHELRDEWPIVIIDEAHQLKDNRTILFSNVASTRYDKLFLASGTPQSNGPKDVWSYLHLIDAEKFPSFWSWVYEHCVTFRNPDTDVLTIGGPKQAKVTRGIVKQYLIRHTKAKVAPELTKSRPPLKVTMTPAQKRYYVDLGFDNMIVSDDHMIMVDNAAERTVRYRQLLITPQLLGFEGESATLKGLREWSDQLDQPIVIFTAFKEAIPHIANALSKRKFQERYAIYGGMPEPRFRQRVQEFEQSTNPHRVLIATIKLSQGYSIHSSTICAFVGPEWEPDLNQQAEDRLSRLGNTNHLTCYYFLNNNTIEEEIYERLALKQKWNDETIDHPEFNVSFPN